MPHSTTVAAGVRRLLSTEEASEYLGCHLRTVFRLIDEGRLKAYRLGRVLKIRPDDLDGALEPVNPAPKNPKDSLDGYIDQQTKPAAS
jgi:excisionase family DNA binding protein